MKGTSKADRKERVLGTYFPSAWRGILALSGEIILLVMIDDLVLESHRLWTFGLGTYLVLVVLLLVIGCYAIWKLRHGTENRLGNMLGTTVPTAKRRMRFLTLICAVVLALSFVPAYLDQMSTREQEQLTAAAPVRALEETFAAVCPRTTAHDPLTDGYDDSGYLVTGKLHYADTVADPSAEEPLESTVSATIGPDGVLHEVTYSFEVDVAQSPEENLARVKADFSQLSPLVARSGVAVAVDELRTFDTLPDEFCEEFLASSLFEDLHLMVSDERGEGGCKVVVQYHAVAAEDITDYYLPYVYVSIRA